MSTRRTKKILNKNYKIHISKTREWKKQQQPERDNEWKNHNKNNNYSAKEKTSTTSEEMLKKAKVRHTSQVVIISLHATLTLHSIRRGSQTDCQRRY